MRTIHYKRNYSDPGNKYKHRHAGVEFELPEGVSMAEGYRLAQVMCALMAKQQPSPAAVVSVEATYKKTFGKSMIEDWIEELEYMGSIDVADGETDEDFFREDW